MYAKIIVTIVLLSVLTRLATGQCPRIVTRAQWRARPPRSVTRMSVFPPTRVIIHHAVSQRCTNQAACSSLVRGFQNHHMNTNGWSDIGYNFLVGEDGNVYEGRGWGRTGAHAPNYNHRGIGICFIGTFTSTLPNAVALSAARRLISCGVSTGQIRSNYRLAGHRQVTQTACPGTTLYNHIKTWPRWTAAP